MNQPETSDLFSQIALAKSVSRELIALLNLETENLKENRHTLPVAVLNDKARLATEKEKVLERLRQFQTVTALTPEIMQSLRELQNIESEFTLAMLENNAAREPDNLKYRYHKAVVLANHGRNLDAQHEFLAVLSKDPTHLGALNDFGNMLLGTGHLSAAHTLYQQAVACHPENSSAHVNLANLLQSQSDYTAAEKHYRMALHLDPELATAHQGLSYILFAAGKKTAAAKHRDAGFDRNPTQTWDYRGVNTPVELLVFCSAYGGNIPLKSLLDNRTFQSTLVFTEYYDIHAALPFHRLVFNAIGDADLCRRALAVAAKFTDKTVAPLINPPALVDRTGRLDNAERLGRLPGVITPKYAALPQTLLANNTAEVLLRQAGIRFPCLIRSPGFHTGHYFLRADHPKDLAEKARKLPGPELLVMSMLDARNENGEFHKFRVMLVDGVLYPLHLAVSTNWKVHYFTSGMESKPEAKCAENAFLQDMPKVLGAKAMTALNAVAQELRLDYCGIDFALDNSGNVLLFEANATMLVPSSEQEGNQQYRRQAAQNILEAVKRMVISRVS